jgi:hypothetical protein
MHANNAFIESCLFAIPEGSEFLLLETVQRTAGPESWFHFTDGQTHAALCEAIDDSRGSTVAVGPHPPLDDDSTDVISCYVPDEDGVVRPGAY